MSDSSKDVRRQVLDTAHKIISTKAYSAVGLNEILKASGVPKGSFYYYFGTKEAFGVELLEGYFDDYIAHIEPILTQSDKPAVARVADYFNYWLDTQSSSDLAARCLVVKLGAEVCDLSEAMRTSLEKGTSRVIARLTQVLEEGVTDASLPAHFDPANLAATLYHLWLGASMHSKITRNSEPLRQALVTTKQLLGLSK